MSNAKQVALEKVAGIKALNQAPIPTGTPVEEPVKGSTFPEVIHETINGKLVSMIAMPTDNPNFPLKMGYRKLSTVLRWADAITKLLPEIAPEAQPEDLSRVKKDQLIERYRIQQQQNDQLQAELLEIKKAIGLVK